MSCIFMNGNDTMVKSGELEVKYGTGRRSKPVYFSSERASNWE